MKTIVVLITGLAVLVILKILRIIINRVGSKNSYWDKASKLFPMTEIIVWVVFVFWAAGLFYKDRIFYPYLLLGMMLISAGLIAWFFFRDIIAGALFKMQHDFKKDDYIRIGSISGQIKSLRHTHLELTAENGQTTKIPYSRLSRELITGMTTLEGMEENMIRLIVDKRIAKPEIEERIKFELANSPWCNYKNPPVIKLQGEDDGTYSFDVLVCTLNNKHLRRVEKALRDKLSNHKL